MPSTIGTVKLKLAFVSFQSVLFVLTQPPILSHSLEHPSSLHVVGGVVVVVVVLVVVVDMVVVWSGCCRSRCCGGAARTRTVA